MVKDFREHRPGCRRSKAMNQQRHHRDLEPAAGATIEMVDGYRGLTWFVEADGDAVADPPGETIDIAAALSGLMPTRSRDAVAVDLQRCADLVIICLAGIVRPNGW